MHCVKFPQDGLPHFMQCMIGIPFSDAWLAKWPLQDGRPNLIVISAELICQLDLI